MYARIRHIQLIANTHFFLSGALGAIGLSLSLVQTCNFATLHFTYSLAHEIAPCKLQSDYLSYR